jgi:catechol 2,3-dioxygenase-like lactoylglutathione lyase family enzyme
VSFDFFCILIPRFRRSTPRYLQENSQRRQDEEIKEESARYQWSAPRVAACARHERPLDLINDLTQKPWPVRVAFFRVPDGELIELLEDKTGYT